MKLTDFVYVVGLACLKSGRFKLGAVYELRAKAVRLPEVAVEMAVHRRRDLGAP
ncbi:hypothetical protein [Gemmatimonas sp.]|uniref:hypothetical protein n=1 Tax=Gemmatimonas sp. TaxID=1962908 RepID=UPI0033408A4B